MQEKKFEIVEISFNEKMFQLSTHHAKTVNEALESIIPSTYQLVVFPLLP